MLLQWSKFVFTSFLGKFKLLFTHFFLLSVLWFFWKSFSEVRLLLLICGISFFFVGQMLKISFQFWVKILFFYCILFYWSSYYAFSSVWLIGFSFRYCCLSLHIVSGLHLQPYNVCLCFTLGFISVICVFLLQWCFDSEIE